MISTPLVESNNLQKKKKSKNSLFEKMSNLIPSNLDDQIVEDEHEDEQPKLTRTSRFKIIKDKHEFGKNRVHSQDEHLKEKLAAVHSAADFGSLHEEDAEHNSDSSEDLLNQNQRKGKPSAKTYSIGYLTK